MHVGHGVEMGWGGGRAILARTLDAFRAAEWKEAMAQLSKISVSPSTRHWLEPAESTDVTTYWGFDVLLWSPPPLKNEDTKTDRLNNPLWSHVKVRAELELNPALSGPEAHCLNLYAVQCPGRGWELPRRGSRQLSPKCLLNDAKERRVI